LKILAVDSSAVTASCALVEDGKLLSYGFVNAGLTHSQTLMPLVSQVLSDADIKLSEIDKLAVSNGPGSFTGVRIGVSTVKGLAFTGNIPCCGISSLLAAAYPFSALNGHVCAVMDARRSQVYTATFKISEKPIRLTDDRAISVADLTDELADLEGDIWLCGDGAQMCYDIMRDRIPNVKLAPQLLRYQNAFGVALVAFDSECIDAAKLLPVYLRLPQAERELKEKSLK